MRGKIGTKGCCVEGLSSDTAAFVSLGIFWDLVACSDRLWEGVKRGSGTPLWPHAFLGRAHSTPSSCRAGWTTFTGWANSSLQKFSMPCCDLVSCT